MTAETHLNYEGIERVCHNITKSTHWSKAGFKSCSVCAIEHHIQHETHLSRESPVRNQRVKDRLMKMKIKIRCKCSRVSEVQYFCHEWQGKCNVKVGHEVSVSQEAGNENFMVSINPPFVFADLTLHGHVPRCNYFSKYLNCLLFYNRGL